MFISTSASTVLADPTVVQVTIDPAKPLPLSTITFNATILSNETIDEVRLLVQECRVDLCFVGGFYVSMVKISNDTYQAQYTLVREEALEIKYSLNIACNKTWYASNTTIITLASNANKDPASTPGFEIVLLFVSVVLLLMRRHYKLKEKK